MVSCRFLCLAVAVCLLGATIFPPEVMAGGGGLRAKKLLAAYLIAKAIKPRFVPIPLPLPFPIKLGKDSYVKHPVHTYSHSAHAQLVHDNYGGYGGGAGGYGGGHGGEGWY
ncbi:uncharacterized protein LOC129966023 [Argiope bruennichi]|uniref:Uncharacterized protein n=1 Tax=Argiope bruennichi TaxID=94029 RepID=A0A8T0E9U0_ARGBR|nr:uncharacterized protein LOC129966023 [Argiope bruennichi]KAF8766985.1 hypothetical protein HNY73_019999 [Argiope bruennichi]